jgi:hypothetical protein
MTRPSPVPRSVQLALLWAGVMFLYIYNDYFQLYMPGTIERMLEGRMGPLGPATPGIMIAVSVMMAIPAMMVGIGALLPRAVARWSHLVAGALYTAIQIWTFAAPEPFYKIVVGLETALTVTIVALALRWTKDVA